MDVDACTEYRAILYGEIIFYGNIRNVSGELKPSTKQDNCFFPVHWLTAKEDKYMYHQGKYLKIKDVPLYHIHLEGGGVGVVIVDLEMLLEFCLCTSM